MKRVLAACNCGYQLYSCQVRRKGHGKMTKQLGIPEDHIILSGTLEGMCNIYVDILNDMHINAN